MAAPLSTPPAAPVQAPVNILLVDDQPGRLLTYRAILEPLGEHLVDCISGADALKRLMEDEFAVILLDVNMPGMDGFETASLIHQHPRFERTPIIFVTAVNVSDLDRMRGYKLGAVDYVMVPVIPEILRTKVEVLVELFRKRRELQLANEHLAAANEALRAEKARELNVLNESLRMANQELAQRNVDLQSQIGEREHAEAQLRELDRRKDEFLATLAHELRNPLAPLRNALEHPQAVRRRGSAAGDDGTPARHAGAADRRPARRGPHQSRQAGAAAWRRPPCRRSCSRRSKPFVAARAPARTRCRSPCRTRRLPMQADPHRLSQVFSNLLSNAAKYSDPAQPDRGERARRRRRRRGRSPRPRHRPHRRAGRQASSICSPRSTRRWSVRAADSASA